MRNCLKIVIVGGGSVNWVPRIVKDMLLTPCLQDAEYVLYDIKASAARLTGRLLQKLVQELDCGATITATDDRAAAFKGAHYYVITISTGGLPSMAHDLRIPEEYGIYHTVGDTAGPGGWARAIRNFDVFVGLAEAINQHSPGAMVLNYTNPMTFLTNVLALTCDGPVVGLCHGLFESLEFLERYYRIRQPDKLAVAYSGLNHFFWITKAKYGRRDLLKDLRRKLATKTFADLGKEYTADAIGFFSHCDLATELFRTAGVMPFTADRHTCEFMTPYITSKANLKKYRLHRTTIEFRRELFRNTQQNVRDLIKVKELPAEYRERTRETAADIIAAHATGGIFPDVGNVPNVGQMPDLPSGTVVETPIMVDVNGFTPLPQPRLPAVAAGLLQPCANAVNMTVRACFTGDRDLALQALRIDPTCARLNLDEITEMGTRLLRAHRKWVSCF